MKIKEYPVSLWHSFRLRYLLKRNRYSDTSRIPVVVSLTSIPTRLKTLDITILSLLSQTRLPSKIVVWLHEDWKEKIPKKLHKLEGDIFEIRYCEGTSSYRKLLPSLKIWPNNPIITVDDDVIYPKNLLDELYKEHLVKKEHIICQYARMITRDNGALLPYVKWSSLRHKTKTARNILPIGEGGVLYPSGCFNAEVFNEQAYMTCAPRADDLWFKAQSYLNNKMVTTLSEFARPIPIIASQVESLKKTNVDKDRNQAQWSRICKAYPKLHSIGL